MHTCQNGDEFKSIIIYICVPCECVDYLEFDVADESIAKTGKTHVLLDNKLLLFSSYFCLYILIYSRYANGKWINSNDFQIAECILLA